MRVEPIRWPLARLFKRALSQGIKYVSSYARKKIQCLQHLPSSGCDDDGMSKDSRFRLPTVLAFISLGCIQWGSKLFQPDMVHGQCWTRQEDKTNQQTRDIRMDRDGALKWSARHLSSVT